MDKYKALSWFNAIALAVICIAALGLAGWTYYQDIRDEQRYSAEINEGRFGAGREGRVTSYSGEALGARQAQILAYEVEGPGFDGSEEGTDVSLVNMTSGKSRRIAGPDQSVVNWEILFHYDGGNNAVGYTAFVANSEQWKQGRMDLVVGALPSLEQHIVARDVRFVDLPVVHGDGNVALILWREDDQAEFVAIDIATGAIIERKGVTLPAVQEKT